MLATFFNLWTQVGKSYFSPTIEAQGNTQMIAKEPTRIGEAGYLVAECELQDVACAKCDNVIGLMCLSSPVNHVLHDSQILLRKTSIVFLKKNGKPVELDVRRKLKLRNDSRPGSYPANDHFTPDSGKGFGPGHGPPNSKNIDFSRLRVDLDAQRESIDRIDTAGFQVLSQFDSAVSRIEKEMAKLNSTIDQLQNDFDLHRTDLNSVKIEVSSGKYSTQNSPKLSRLESQVRTTNAAISEMKKLSEAVNRENVELRNDLLNSREDCKKLENVTLGLQADVAKTNKSVKNILDMNIDSAKETAILRTELRQLRQMMDQDRKKKVNLSKQQIPLRELDILTSNMTKIGARASQVETLQMEFDLFKSRIQHLEASTEHLSPCEESQLAPIQQSKSAATSRPSNNAYPMSNDLHQEAPAKVFSEATPASLKVSQPASRKRKAPAEKVAGAGEGNKSPRLTRSGAIDKRSIKKPRASLPADSKV
ncbi:hypothetical protein CNYM01_10157 [Colletotrichum nymphaeae SA-01]|uniref:Uncharacterized protein n=1 Tax=Colletotrichum nymphaeae SA-01 TaxID=1460502 RepID=A0A135U0T5_9PEZI|nr:hypothetical protein CNYM01_10157 [Colletotrichum nymphaeae SA-01]